MAAQAGKQAIIIGAGVGGLAAAIRLRVMGYAVTVFEANAYPGGKLSLIEQDGYSFDAGPSLFTLPHLVTDLFELAGKNPADYFQYKPLDEVCRYFFDDGVEFIAPPSWQWLAMELQRVFGEPAGHTLEYLKTARLQYETAGQLFLFRPLNRASTFLNAKAAKAIAHLPSMGLWQTLNGRNQKQFMHPRVVQFFNRFATYNGSSPYKTPGMMSVIPWLEHGLGAFYPKGGMHSITLSLYKLAQELGVAFQFNQKASEIIVQQGRATGIKTNGQTHQADLVVSNMDMVATYRYLLKGQPQPEKLLNQPKSSSALIFYWGISKQFDQLGLHNIFFSNDYEKEFHQLFEEKTIGPDPTVYINITSKHDPGHAPAGCENWFVMVNAPHNVGQDWPALIAQTRQAVLRKLSQRLGHDIEPLIATQAVLDPRLIEQRTSSWLGALYGNASNSPFSAFLRHPNRAPRIAGLYFCGGSVHPGGGVPLALASAQIMAGEVQRYQ